MKSSMFAVLALILFIPSAVASESPTHQSATAEIRSTTTSSFHSNRKKGPWVHLLANDTRFHAASCPRLKLIESTVTLDEAMLAGYGPCPRCSRDVLEELPVPKPSRSSIRARQRRASTVSSGPPYIVIVRPQHRTVNSFPPIGFTLP